MKARFFILIGLTTLTFLFTTFSVYNLQISEGDDYRRKAHAQNEAAEALAAPRGIIYVTDKNGAKIPAALTKESPLIFAVPDEVHDPDPIAEVLTPILGIDQDQLRAMLAKEQDKYELLSEDLTQVQIDQTKEFGLEGIYVASKKHRYYPLESLAAQVLGFVGLTEYSDTPNGRYGLEAYYDNELRGKNQSFSGSGLTEAVAGKDLELTIDRNIQVRAEEILSALVEEYRAESGSVIVQDPRSGAILAMANAPSFDPNKYFEVDDIGLYTNTAVGSIYEPGSVFKIITVAAGIDSGAITPETIYHDRGEVVLNGKTIKNWDLEAHGDITMTEAIENSVNTAMTYAEAQMGHETFYKYLKKFGFKDRTEIDLPSEALGSLRPLEQDIRDINYATASFGQGVSVTPIRLITAFSAIANDGILMRPFLNAEQKPSQVRRVISKETADQVTEMMVSAVKKAFVADIRHYDVAGKTGTAQVPDFVNGGYLEFSEGLINTYIGFAPASNPQFTILIKLDKPYGSPFAGQTVVPAFKELAQFILNYAQIPPDNLDE
ncbi:MAG: penicillin-binding protein 2 [Candidatus Harrisonbacteria bacterium]|nr:penicillin-binding protein 2 [Candidatus Harrisonbacteria bacterium]